MSFFYEGTCKHFCGLVYGANPNIDPNKKKRKYIPNDKIWSFESDFNSRLRLQLGLESIGFIVIKIEKLSEDNWFGHRGFYVQVMYNQNLKIPKDGIDFNVANHVSSFDYGEPAVFNIHR